jgi:hypothetical protein
MRNFASNQSKNFVGVINEITMKHYQDHDNLVLDVNGHDKQTWEDIMLNLNNIKSTAEDVYGAFDNIDIVIH